jgi:hypothetical protein
MKTTSAVVVLVLALAATPALSGDPDSMFFIDQQHHVDINSQACEADRVRLCPDLQWNFGAARCLYDKKKQVSPKCTAQFANFARTPPLYRQRQDCEADRLRFCADSHWDAGEGQPSPRKCLYKRLNELTLSCAAHIRMWTWDTPYRQPTAEDRGGTR